MTTRREFLKLLGAAATLAAVPAIARGRLIAEAPYCTGRTVLLECAPLEAGRRYTFTAQSFVARQWRGLFVAGITAKGGETAIRVPVGEAEALHGPCLSLEPFGFVLPYRASDEQLVDFTSSPSFVAGGGVEVTPRTNELLNTTLDYPLHV